MIIIGGKDPTLKDACERITRMNFDSATKKFSGKHLGTVTAAKEDDRYFFLQTNGR